MALMAFKVAVAAYAIAALLCIVAKIRLSLMSDADLLLIGDVDLCSRHPVLGVVMVLAVVAGVFAMLALVVAAIAWVVGA